MWFLILLFLVLGGLAVLVRSTKTLLVLAVTFSFIAMLYTPWWPIVFLLISGVALIVYLDKKDVKVAQENEWKQSISREIQNEVEIGDMIKRMQKQEKRF